MDETQHNINTDGIQDSRKDTEQKQIKYSMGKITTKPLFLLSSS
jgi:hypothetical protein